MKLTTLACLAALCVIGQAGRLAVAAPAAAPAAQAQPSLGRAGRARRPRRRQAAALLRGLQPRLASARAPRRQAPPLPDPLQARLRTAAHPCGAAAGAATGAGLGSRARPMTAPAPASASREAAPPSRRVKLVVFDVDGTLVDSQHLIVAAQGIAFAENGLPAPEPARGALRGRPVAAAGVPPPRRRGRPDRGPLGELQAAFNRLRLDPAYEEPLFPGMARSAGAASCPRRRADRPRNRQVPARRRPPDRPPRLGGLVRHDAERRRRALQARPDHAAAGDGGGRLPTPAPPIMVGDTTFDMAMGVAAGAVAIGVGWGYHPPGALFGAGAVTVVERGRAGGRLLRGVEPR